FRRDGPGAVLADRRLAHDLVADGQGDRGAGLAGAGEVGTDVAGGLPIGRGLHRELLDLHLGGGEVALDDLGLRVLAVRGLQLVGVLTRLEGLGDVDGERAVVGHLAAVGVLAVDHEADLVRGARALDGPGERRGRAGLAAVLGRGDDRRVDLDRRLPVGTEQALGAVLAASHGVADAEVTAGVVRPGGRRPGVAVGAAVVSRTAVHTERVAAHEDRAAAVTAEQARVEDEPGDLLVAHGDALLRNEDLAAAPAGGRAGLARLRTGDRADGPQDVDRGLVRATGTAGPARDLRDPVPLRRDVDQAAVVFVAVVHRARNELAQRSAGELLRPVLAGPDRLVELDVVDGVGQLLTGRGVRTAVPGGQEARVAVSVVPAEPGRAPAELEGTGFIRLAGLVGVAVAALVIAGGLDLAFGAELGQPADLDLGAGGLGQRNVAVGADVNGHVLAVDGRAQDVHAFGTQRVRHVRRRTRRFGIGEILRRLEAE